MSQGSFADQEGGDPEPTPHPAVRMIAKKPREVSFLWPFIPSCCHTLGTASQQGLWRGGPPAFPSQGAGLPTAGSPVEQYKEHSLCLSIPISSPALLQSLP